MQTLTLIEATGIQSYIFGSNQLRQNIGASELVRQATIDWVRDALEELCPGRHNFTGLDEADLPVIGDADLLQDGLAAEVVYVGGGNAMLLFADRERAIALARFVSRRALQDAPGLHLALAHHPVELGRGDLWAQHQAAHQALFERKQRVRGATPQLGLAVTAECDYTGAPAVAVDEGQLVSAEVVAKRKMWDQRQDQRLHAVLPQVHDEGFDFVHDFGDLGSPGESSFLAIVHADGNRMGQRIQSLGERHQGDDRGYLRALRAFSRSVQDASTAALRNTAARLLARVDKRTRKIADTVPIQGWHLPFRPIVFGGDDVTFVTEGRLGLSLAAHYLRDYSAHKLADGDYAHARAGVAVVKTHYPFSRAYDLAEDLCASAKRFIADLDRERRRTAIDWHFAVGGFTRSLGEIREREYTVPAGSLLMRPLQIDAGPGTWRTWDQFTETIHWFQDPKGQWEGRRNKVKALREALREGPEAVTHFMATHRELSGLPAVADRPQMAEQGWQGPECGYFDVVEALDFYIDL